MPTALSTRRLVAVAATLFLLILAFLAARVHAGADPTQATTPASNVTPAEPTPAPSSPDTPSSGDGGPYGGGSGGPGDADPYGAPGGGPPPGLDGTVPDQDGTVPVPDADPPATFAS